MLRDEPAPRSASTGRAARVDVTRRKAIRQGGTIALGAMVAWSVPSMRTTVLRADAQGTPQPAEPQVEAQAVLAAGESPAARLPFTGIDPKPLIIAGTATLTTGAALLAAAQDPEPL